MQLFWHHVLKTCLLFYESNNFVVNHIVKYVGIFCRLYFFLTCFISSCTNTTILKVTVVVVLASQLCLILCDLMDCGMVLTPTKSPGACSNSCPLSQ